MEGTKLSGDAQTVGARYGETFADKIKKNLSILVWRKGYEPLPLQDPAFQRWVAEQEEVVAAHWPWLVEEMRGVAQGAGVEYRDILLLNLRAWQYQLYSGCACSSVAVRLAGGAVANAGALDDPREYYCGLVEISPKHGHKLASFPITGTSWGNRGMNAAGLCVGISSQLLPGLRRNAGAVNQDLAVRALLQTCANVAEAREFCLRHPFTMNLLCSDSQGAVLCAHQTSAGLFELAADAPCALTNHVADDRTIFALSGLGAKEFPESGTSRLRRGRLLDFAERRGGKCSGEEVRGFLADQLSGHAASACPQGNIVLTYAAPQAEPGAFWTAEPQVGGTWTRHEL